MKNTDTQTITQVLIVFLFKLKTGNSNKVNASVLGLPHEQVSTLFNEILKSFEKDILPFSVLSLFCEKISYLTQLLLLKNY